MNRYLFNSEWKPPIFVDEIPHADVVYDFKWKFYGEATHGLNSYDGMPFTEGIR